MNKEDMQQVFKKLGLNKEQIKRANDVHKNLQKGGETVEDKFKTEFGFDTKTMEQLHKIHENVLKQNAQNKALVTQNRTLKLKKGGGQGVRTIGLVGSLIIQYGIGGYYLPALHIAWGLISTALDAYVDGNPVDDTQLGYICKLMYWVLPTAAVQYLISVVYLDTNALKNKVEPDISKFSDPAGPSSSTPKQYGPYEAAPAPDMQPMQEPEFFKQVPTMATNSSKIEEFPEIDKSKALVLDKNSHTQSTSIASFQPTTGGPNLPSPLSTIDQLKHAFYHLYNLALTYSGQAVTLAGQNKVKLTVVIVAAIGTYLYIRFSGNKEKNKELDKKLYLNYKRRAQILKAYAKKAKHEEQENERRQTEYEEKVEESIRQQLDFSKSETPAASKTKSESKWQKYKIVDDDNDAVYQKHLRRSDTRTRKRSSQSRDKEEEKENNAAILEKIENSLST